MLSQKHQNLNECIYDAIDLDDKCHIYRKDKPINGSLAPSSRSITKIEHGHTAEAKAVAELVMKIMNQMFRPP